MFKKKKKCFGYSIKIFKGDSDFYSNKDYPSH